jgi:hypothetical protein
MGLVSAPIIRERPEDYDQLEAPGGNKSGYYRP